MKKYLTLVLLMIFLCFYSQAQNFRYGAKAGLNLATLKPDLSNPANRVSLHIGGLIEVPIHDKFYIQPELLFSGQGATDSQDDDETVRLNYLTIPIMAKYRVYEELCVEAGPQIGFLLSAEREDTGETTDLMDISKSVDFGVAFGASYELEQGILFGIRYYIGSDINDIDTDSDKIANRVFQLSVGYILN